MVPMQKRLGTARCGAGLLVVAALVGACGSDDGEGAGGGGEDDVVIEASPAFLSEAAQRSEESSRRMAMTISLDGGEPVPMMEGEFDGDRFSTTMDMGGMASAMAEQTGESLEGIGATEGMTMEMVGDPSQQFIRTPIFAMVEEQEPGGFGPAGQALAEIDDQWGRIDITALGDALPSDVQEAITGQGADPSAFFDLVANAEGVEELGEDEVDGIAVTGMSADVLYGDLLESSGTDAEALARSMPGEDAERITSALGDLTMPMEVWVDDEGLVRRMAYTLDTEELLAELDLPVEEAPEEALFAIAYTIDVSDYGAEDIDIQFPEDSVDITDAFAQLMAS